MVSFVNQMTAVAQRYLNKNTKALDQSLERLSSGYKVNRSKDDAAGYQISNKLNAQIRGNQQAIQNAQDGMSLLGVVEGAYNSFIDGVQRIRELTVQYASDTLGIEQRNAIKQEIFSIVDNLDQIEKSTSFNGKAVFSQSLFYSWGIDVNSQATTSEGVMYHDIFRNFFYGNYKNRIQLGGNSSLALDTIDLGEALPFLNLKYNLLADNNDNDLDPLEDDEYPYPNGGTHTPGESARGYIKTLDAFLSYFGKQLATVGSFQNQLQNTVNSLTITNENYQAARSRIVDVDVAKESSNLTRNQILQQASTSVLIQANQQSSVTLQLIQNNRI